MRILYVCCLYSNAEMKIFMKARRVITRLSLAQVWFTDCLHTAGHIETALKEA